MINEYDLNQIKKEYLKEKEEIAEWLKKSGRNPNLLGSFVMRVTFDEIGAMIQHIEALHLLLEDDMK